MKFLICYASTEGQTRKICRFCLDQLFAQGHSVELIGAGDAGDVELAGFDGAILAGSVHAGQIQSELKDFATEHAQALNKMPTLYLQVSLTAAGTDPDELAELDVIANAFTDATGWTPGAVHHIAGAFRFSEYDFFKSLAMRYIASRKDEEVNPYEDREYTDWQALAELMKSWPPSIGRPG